MHLRLEVPADVKQKDFSFFLLWKLHAAALQVSLGMNAVRVTFIQQQSEPVSRKEKHHFDHIWEWKPGDGGRFSRGC